MKFIISLFSICILCNSMMAQIEFLEKKPYDLGDCIFFLGQDTSSTLNDCESKFLNYLFVNRRGNFDFTEKKIAFLMGSGGTIMTTKSYFFEGLIEDKDVNEFCKYALLTDQLVVFEEEDLKQTGFNAVITISCKRLMTRKKAIKQLKKIYRKKQKSSKFL